MYSDKVIIEFHIYINIGLFAEVVIKLAISHKLHIQLWTPFILTFHPYHRLLTDHLSTHFFHDHRTLLYILVILFELVLLFPHYNYDFVISILLFRFLHISIIMNRWNIIIHCHHPIFCSTILLSSQLSNTSPS